eukprot:12723922-Ditylum_brightwellii.AAC.1
MSPCRASPSSPSCCSPRVRPPPRRGAGGAGVGVPPLLLVRVRCSLLVAASVGCCPAVVRPSGYMTAAGPL